MFPNTIVVPLDGSEFAERAVGASEAIARQGRGRLLLMTAHAKAGEDGGIEYLEKVAARSGLEVSTVVVADEAVTEAIESVVGDAPGRVVCMTTHGRGRMRWALLGSVAESVVRGAASPVLLVGRHCRTEWPKPLRKVLMCVDDVDTTHTMVPEVASWAKALGLDVQVATVVHPLDATFPDRDLDAIVRQFETRGVRAVQCVLRSRYPAGELADFAGSIGADLIAMRSHGRAGAARLALGSVTMGVVGMADCPVLVHKTV